jgi:hypothetical protein
MVNRELRPGSFQFFISSDRRNNDGGLFHGEFDSLGLASVDPVLHKWMVGTIHKWTRNRS